MLLTTGQARLELADDEVARLRDACDSRLEVVDGFVWLTVEGDREDVVLAPGDSYVVDTSDQVIVSALRGAAAIEVHDHANVIACAARRDRAHPSAAEVRRAAKPGRLRELLMGVSISSVALA
jgi:hypothetical protein